MLFQIAAVCLFALDNHVPCYIGNWYHNRSLAIQQQPFGGSDNKALAKIFPSLMHVEVETSVSLNDSIAALVSTELATKYVPMAELFDHRVTSLIAHSFFHHTCMFA